MNKKLVTENMKERIKKFLFEGFEKYPLEHKYMLVISGLASLGAVLATLTNLLLNSITLTFVSIICSLVYITSFFLVRFGKNFRFVSWLMVLNTIIMIDFNWFHLEGSRGSSFLMILILLICSFLILQKSDKLPGILILFINLGALLYAEYNYPHLIKPYTGALNRIIDMSVTFCLCAFIILMFISNTLNNYYREKVNAEKADKLKSAFLCNINHELRTPINAIIGFSELISDENITKEQQTIYSGYIKKSCRDLEKLMENIIDIARIKSKQLPINKEKIDIATLLTYVFTYFNDKFNMHKNTKVSLILNEDNIKRNDYIETDQTHLTQILISLTDNALKFTTEGYAEIGYYNRNSHFLFYVKDTGIGIKKEYKKSIFNMFLQADNSTTRKYGGAGLGLAISKGLVELLGGKIWFESEINKGTTFYFTIPT